MAVIIQHPALCQRRTQPTELPAPRLTLRAAFIALAAPALAVALAWAMVDAIAFTQNSLVGFYSATSLA